MDINDYQMKALESLAIKDKSLAALAHRSLGLAGEAASAVKKVIRDRAGEPSADDIQKISEKLGDSMYYVAVLAEYFDINLQTVAEQNLSKSQKFKKERKNK